MNGLKTIWIIARFELKTLFRSWFFRILSIIGLFILTVFNLVILVDDSSNWEFMAIPAVLPYVNMIILNIAQSIIVAFIATEFLKRDKKLDTTEVIYIRSMSNGEYVLGKTLGTLMLFLILNVLVLSFGMLINFLMDDVAIDFISYVLYPLLISIPTLIFIIGLSYILMLLIKNQAVTFVILLGYFFVALFYFDSKFNYALNFVANTLPMFKSEMAGMPNWNGILQHRLGYLFLGIGLNFLTVLLISRLEQSKKMSWSSGIISISSMLIGFGLLTAYILDDFQLKSERELLKGIQKEYIMKDNPEIQSTKLEITHLESEIRGTANLELSNDADLNSFYIILNPGLKIESIKLDGSDVTFTRNAMVVEIPQTIVANKKYTMEVIYQGTIDDRMMYLDIDQETLDIINRIEMFNLAKEYFYLSPNYVLLTREASWYPTTRIPFSKEAGIMTPVQFGLFDLTVHTKEGFLPISQGKRSNVSSNEYQFIPEQPLSQISLAIGLYEERTIKVDSIDYHLVMQKGHFYFDSQFELLKDTLPKLITEVKNDFELELGINYPFKRFSIVEVPAQFVSYPRIFTDAREYMQPEMSFVHEKGIGIENADFVSRKKRMADQNKENGSELTEMELESKVLTQFFTNTITVSRNRNVWRRDGEEYIYRETYSVFPNYYSYSNFIQADDWAFFNKAFEGYLWKKVAPESEFRVFSALTPIEKANQKLMKEPLNTIIGNEALSLANQAILNKGVFLISGLQAKMGVDQFNSSLAKMISENRFKTTTIKNLNNYFTSSDSSSMEQSLKEVLIAKELPAFKIGSAMSFKFIEGNRTKYQVRFTVENTSNVEGIISATIQGSAENSGGSNRSRFSFNNEDGEHLVNERLIVVKNGQKKEISILATEEPRTLSINTFVSINLPSSLSLQIEDPKETSLIREEYERVLIPEVEDKNQYEFVVDDLDPGFSITQGIADTPLRAWIRGEQVEEEEYEALNWRAPRQWKKTISSFAYGNEIKSARFIGTGEGNQLATWKSELNGSGYYDVFVYINTRINPFVFGDQSKENYQYRIYTSEGVEEVEVITGDAEPGWNNLGSYFFDEGEAKIELTNKSAARTVIADAVKWVKR